jgi:hypothetical protein
LVVGVLVDHQQRRPVAQERDRTLDGRATGLLG